VPQRDVNLKLVHTLLKATDEQPYGFLRVRGAELIHEVEMMAAARLVDASFFEDEEGPGAVINRVNNSGTAFLRAFRNSQPDSAPPVPTPSGQFARVA